jgi:hypothetical protein
VAHRHDRGRFVNAVGRLILIVIYAILGLAATGRAAYQISIKFAEAPVAYSVSALSALLYVTIAVALWRGWKRTAVAGTIAELAGVMVVGTLGWAAPGLWPDQTVWTAYGVAYGWVPLALPIVALWVLLGTHDGSTTAVAPGS